MKIKKMLLFGLMMLILPVVYGVNVGVVIEEPNGEITHACVNMKSGAYARDILDAVGLAFEDTDIEWTGTGTMSFLKSVNGIGYDEYGEGKGWAFSLSEGGAFDVPPEKSEGVTYGLGDYEVEEGDIIGLSFSEISFTSGLTIDNLPPDTLFEEVCGLYIDDLNIDVQGDSSDADEGGETIKEAEPSGKVEFEIKLLNYWDDEDDIEIEDITATATVLELDDGDDIDEDVDFEDIQAEDKETATIELDIPDDAEDDDYEMFILIEGDDGDIDYYTIILMELEVDRPSHKVVIGSANVIPSYVGCEREVEFQVNVENLGSSDEEVELRVQNIDIDVYHSEEFDLDEGDDKTIRFSNIIPEDISERTYTIYASIDYRNGRESESTSFTIESERCGEEQQTTTTSLVTTTTAATIPGTDMEIDGQNIPLSVEGESNSFAIWLIPLVIVLVIVVIVLGFILSKN